MKKIILLTLVALVACFMPCFAQAENWGTRRIDNETHRRNHYLVTDTELENGVYYDIGDWKSWQYSAINGYYRYLSVEVSPERHGIAFWYVKIPRAGFYQIKTAYFSTKHRTNDADYAVYLNVSPQKAIDKGAKPVFEKVVNQRGHGAITKWADMGTYCLKKDDVSMLVLDGRDDSESDSTDATDWIYVGEEYKGEYCVGGIDLAPITYLLMKRK